MVRLGKIARGQGRQSQKYLGQPYSISGAGPGANKIPANYVPGPMPKRVAAKKSRRLAWVFFHGAGAGPDYSFLLPRTQLCSNEFKNRINNQLMFMRNWDYNVFAVGPVLALLENIFDPKI